jgi:hypothetical protein
MPNNISGCPQNRAEIDTETPVSLLVPERPPCISLLRSEKKLELFSAIDLESSIHKLKWYVTASVFFVWNFFCFFCSLRWLGHWSIPISGICTSAKSSFDSWSPWSSMEYLHELLKELDSSTAPSSYLISKVFKAFRKSKVCSSHNIDHFLV